MSRLLYASMFAMAFAASSIAWSQQSSADEPQVKPDRVIVMYFHRTERCPTCKLMGSYSEEAVKKGFAEQLKDGSAQFRMIDFEKKENSAIAKAYRITGPALIVAKITDQQVEKFKDLEEIWTKVREKPKFIDYVQDHVKTFLK